MADARTTAAAPPASFHPEAKAAEVSRVSSENGLAVIQSVHWGPFTKDVRKIFGLFDPLPPSCPHFGQIYSTVHTTSPAFGANPPVPLGEDADVLCECTLGGQTLRPTAAATTPKLPISILTLHHRRRLRWRAGGRWPPRPPSSRLSVNICRTVLIQLVRDVKTRRALRWGAAAAAHAYEV